MPSQSYFSGFDTLSAEYRNQLLPDAYPHYLNSDGEADAVVICLHGFTGVTYEVYPAVKAISKAGLSAVAPLLPGHGYQDPTEQKRQFAQITREGLFDAARQEVARARQRYRRVGMFGFSMGGAISLTMAAEGLLDACAVAAPALRLPRKAELLIPLLSWASFTLSASSQEPFYLPGYEFHHSWALRALWQVANHARTQLPKIQCPVLGIHSHQDLTIPPVVLELMQEQIPVPIETDWFDGSGHCMLLDKRGVEVASAATAFLQRHLVSV